MITNSWKCLANGGLICQFLVISPILGSRKNINVAKNWKILARNYQNRVNSGQKLPNFLGTKGSTINWYKHAPVWIPTIFTLLLAINCFFLESNFIISISFRKDGDMENIDKVAGGVENIEKVIEISGTD